MASDTESTSSTHPSDFHVNSDKLPDHNEHSIYYGHKTYKRGKAQPRKQRDKSYNAWYWTHGEVIFDSEENRRRWMCKPCWNTKNFTHYSQTSNKAVIKHLQEAHNIHQSDDASGILSTDN